ncbi:hypothetical protein DFH09DRAFT_1098917 [Mycena vulgaris]|nr:hypothetical protein DFH09DRAFT_1098917 [Mycena vulgaris]
MPRIFNRLVPLVADLWSLLVALAASQIRQAGLQHFLAPEDQIPSRDSLRIFNRLVPLVADLWSLLAALAASQIRQAGLQCVQQFNTFFGSGRPDSLEGQLKVNALKLNEANRDLREKPAQSLVLLRSG